MLESLGLWPQILARIESGPLGCYVEHYADRLKAEGYARAGIRRHVAAIDAFGVWLKRNAVSVESIDENTLQRFGRRFPRWRASPSHPSGRENTVVAGARRFAEELWARGVAHKPATASPGTEIDRFLLSYQEHLASTKGLVQGTQRIYLRYARGLCESQFGAARLDWSTLRASDIADFVCAEAARLKPGSSRIPVTAVRSLLRFLEMKGSIPRGLSGAVPTVRQWKHASLPAVLSVADVERVLADRRAESPIVRRDRAILLLLARLGLRASEVATLRLGDIDWKGGRIEIRAGKTARGRSLPLPLDVGEALVAYIRGGRADGLGPCVFQLSLPPLGCMSNSGVAAVAARALRHAGVPAACRGSHVFRRSVATKMVCGGARFKEVADVLGHALVDTTAIYAKLDVDTLQRVALPWPGGA